MIDSPETMGEIQLPLYKERGKMEDWCDRTLQMLATAVEKEEKGRDFYKEAAEKCATDLGKQMFRTLMAEEGIHIQRLKQIHEQIHKRKVWSAEWKACRVENEDLNKLVKERISKLGPQVKAESSDLEALEIGIQMEQGAINFYEEMLGKASDPQEMDFVKHMITEERRHFVALEDLKLYFTNPESWFVEKEHHVLDGA
jgi:rubrerythrin